MRVYDMKKKKKLKEADSNKIMTVILGVLGIIILSYIVQAVYFSHTGAIVTEITSYVTVNDTLSVEGIAIRDEVKTINGINTAILTKPSGGVCLPIVNDGENVAKDDSIAYRFSTEEQAQAYRQIEEIDRKLRYLGLFQKMGNSNNADISALNSDITLSVNRYLEALESNDLINCEELLADINYAFISRQAATGTVNDFTKEISSYNAERKVLMNQIGKKTGISAPFAGYFVSTVDGYEGIFDYSKLDDTAIKVDQVSQLLAAEPDNTYAEKAFGKMIGQHIWYFVFNIPVSDSSSLSTGSTFSVSFPEQGIEDVEMTVVNSSKSDDTLAVVLKCKTINKELLKLRKETAVIKLKSYSGYKISNDAITDDGNGNIGVYVYSGQAAVFKPITVVYRNSDFVLAEDESKKEKEQKDEETKDEKKIIKPYDRIILKGRNLYDGKVLG